LGFGCWSARGSYRGGALPEPTPVQGCALAANLCGIDIQWRFVRAGACVATLRLVANAAELELSALHVLNNFDIPFAW